MDWTAEQLMILRKNTDAANHGDAPRAVLEAAGSLLGPDKEPLAVLCGATAIEGRITWRLAILTESTLIYVEAARQATVWAAGRGFGEEKSAESLTAWAKSLRAVTEVTVESTTPWDNRDDPSTGAWTATYVIGVGDGSIPLPLPGFRSTEAAERAERFVLELLQRI